MLRPIFMLGARWEAAKHIRFGFARKGCHIWRLYTHFGWRTYWIGCECGATFADRRKEAPEPTPDDVIGAIRMIRAHHAAAR